MHSPFLRAAAISFFVFLAALRPCPVFGDDASKPHVAVLDFANDTGSPSYDAACRSATSTLALALRQLGRYAVQSEKSPGAGEDALRAMAADRRLDFVIFGKLAKPASGGIECSLSVFDRAKGKTAISRAEKATGVLDIFDATDSLVVAVLEAMTGSHIGFGSVALKNTGEKGSYSVLLDGSPAGEDLASLDKVLVGKRAVAIVQKRMLGDREIAKAALTVKEGDSVELSFAVPLLMDDEKARLEALKSAIKAGWDDESRAAEVDGKIAELSSLLKDVAFSPRLAAQRDEARQLSGERTMRRLRFAIEAAAWDPKLELLDAGSAAYSGAKGYPDPARIRSAFEEDARLLETLFVLKAGKSLGEGSFDSALGCLANALMITARYLDGGRLTDYAYALTALKGIQEASGAGPRDDRSLKAVFGDAMRAGEAFYKLKDKAAAGASVLVGSDLAKALSVDGGGYALPPIALKPAAGARSLGVQPEGEAKPAVLPVPPRLMLVFVLDGFAPFGRVAINTAAPGAVYVDYKAYNMMFNPDSPVVCSLDGGDEVEAPHLFENVPAGEHVVRIPEVRAQDRLYGPVEEKILVEPGKRAGFSPILVVGRGKLRLEGLPEGAAFTIDGEERQLSKDPSGAVFFEGEVDAGFPRLEVVLGNRKWYSSFIQVSDKDSRDIPFTALRSQIMLKPGTVKLKGKLSDWDGIESVFRPTPSNTPPEIGGSLIAGGAICRDEKNVYVRIDFSNGKPADFGNDCWRVLQLYQLGNHVDLSFNVWGSKGHSIIWEEKGNRTTECGSYAIGPSFVEISIPISRLPRYLDIAKPFLALVGYGDKSGYWAGSPKVEILLQGK